MGDGAQSATRNLQRLSRTAKQTAAISSDSAEQPAECISKRAEQAADLISDSSAVQPAKHAAISRNKKKNSRAVASSLDVTAAYISLPFQCYQTKAERSSIIDVLKEVKQGTLNIINIVFAKADDIDIMWTDINAHMKRSAEQPALQYRINGRLMTVFSQRCGKLVSENIVYSEDAVPSICLTFEKQGGRMMVLNTVWPDLPTEAQSQWLAKHTNPAATQINSTCFIGGELCAPLFLSHLLHKQGLDYELSFEADTAVLVKTSGLHTFQWAAQTNLDPVRLLFRVTTY